MQDSAFIMKGNNEQLMMSSLLKTIVFGNFLRNDLGMRNFLPNGFGMMKSPANLWRHRNLGVAEDVMLTV